MRGPEGASYRCSQRARDGGLRNGDDRTAYQRVPSRSRKRARGRQYSGPCYNVISTRQEKQSSPDMAHPRVTSAAASRRMPQASGLSPVRPGSVSVPILICQAPPALTVHSFPVEDVIRQACPVGVPRLPLGSPARCYRAPPIPGPASPPRDLSSTRAAVLSTPPRIRLVVLIRSTAITRPTKGGATGPCSRERELATGAAGL